MSTSSCGVSLMEAGARVAKHLDEHVPEQADSMRVFVGHGGSFRHAAYHLGVLKREELSSLSMHFDQPVFLAKERGQWTHVGGQWKPRKAMDRLD